MKPLYLSAVAALSLTSSALADDVALVHDGRATPKIVLEKHIVVNPTGQMAGASTAPAIAKDVFVNCGNASQCYTLCVKVANSIWAEQAKLPRPTQLWNHMICYDTAGNIPSRHWKN